MSLRDMFGLGNKRATPPPVDATVVKLPPPCTGAGLYGKLPIAADFIRLNAGGFASGGFDCWLEDGMGAVLASGGAPNQALVTFFACSASAPNAVIGMMGPSVDKVGRNFPAALFAYLDPSLTNALAFAAEAVGSFLFEAQAHVAGLAQALAAPAVSEIGVPTTEAQLIAVADSARQLGAANLHETLAMVFGSADENGWVHAIGICLAACSTSKNRFPDKASVTLELPAGDDRARDFWLALVSAALAWPTGAPSWLWDSDSNRLLLALGPPTPSLFVALALPGRAGARHWVVRTGSADAVLPAVSEHLRVCLGNPSATVGEFLETVSR